MNPLKRNQAPAHVRRPGNCAAVPGCATAVAWRRSESRDHLAEGYGCPSSRYARTRGAEHLVPHPDQMCWSFTDRDGPRMWAAGSSLTQALNNERFRLSWSDHSPFGERGGGYLALSHEQNINAWFSEDGVAIRPTGADPLDKWTFGMKLKAYGYGDRLNFAPGSERRESALADYAAGIA